MIVGQRPGASPRLLVIIIAILAAVWVAREAVHRRAPEARAPAGAAATRPASIIVDAPAPLRSTPP